MELATPNKEYRPKSRDEIARNMAAIRSKDNRVEAELRKLLHAMGFRYRAYAQHVLGKPDIVFPRECVAIFVDGDFWHCRILVEEGLAALKKRMKTERKDYWIDKFKLRVKRDEYVTAQLESDGWLVIRLWESDVAKRPEYHASRIAKAVEWRRYKRTIHR